MLPDKHKPDSDTVLWMNDVHATKEEAQQAGAVVALARVSTTLPLERLLPSQFIPTWTRALEVSSRPYAVPYLRSLACHTTQQRLMAAMSTEDGVSCG